MADPKQIVRITAKRAGFRRCGIAHPDRATDYPIDRFTNKQIAVLRNEPMLVVQLLAADLVAAEEKADRKGNRNSGAAKPTE